ncbi:HTH domain-containing protein [Chitinophaga sedimenti]|uniref:HTH domain-containing protein n=1 Tax=Chitinophaga sedimenti TaxID=2033606 RepID=UPI0035582ECE
MALKNTISRLEYLDNLICKRSTGTPKQLARKLNVSERSIRDHISLLKELGAPVRYCRQRNSYYYHSIGRFHFKFKTDPD